MFVFAPNVNAHTNEKDRILSYPFTTKIIILPVIIFRTDGIDMTEDDMNAAVNLVWDTLDMFGEDIPGFDASKYIKDRMKSKGRPVAN